MDILFIADTDIVDYINFYNRTCNSNLTLKQWCWRLDGPGGKRGLFAIAKQCGVIVGAMSLTPIMMADVNGNFLGAKFENALVDPCLDSDTIFHRMYEFLMNYVQSNGMQVLWGLEDAKKSFKYNLVTVSSSTSKLVFPISVCESMVIFDNVENKLYRNILSVVVGAASILSGARIVISSRNNYCIRLEILKTPPCQAEMLCREFLRGWGGQTILRTADFIAWRYYENPVVRATLLGAYRDNSLVGWLAYTLDDNSMGYIVDAIVLRSDDSEEIVHLLALQAVLALRSAGAVAIQSWLLGNHPFDKLVSKVLRGLGFYGVCRGTRKVDCLSADQVTTISLPIWDDWFAAKAN